MLEKIRNPDGGSHNYSTVCGKLSVPVSNKSQPTIMHNRLSLKHQLLWENT